MIARVLDKKPGQRFLYAYTKLNNYFNKNLIYKVSFIILGIILLLLGLILLLTPGPGLILIILGAMLLCATSKKIAKKFDHFEKKIRT